LQDAQTALVALSLLVPTVSETADAYLGACKEADVLANNTDQRRQLRDKVEATVSSALGLGARPRYFPDG